MGFINTPPVRILAVLALLASFPAHAVNVSLAGVFGRKAVLVIDGGSPRTLAPGASSPEGVRLLSIEGDSVWVEIDGKREQLRIGQHVASSRSESPGAATIHLNADAQGHFMSAGAINGAAVNFMVDTGATVIAIGRADARRAGIDTARGRAITVQTANGVVRAWRIRLHSVKVGAVTLRDIDAAVMEIDMPYALLGMSFLNRMDMQRNGQIMTLKQRF
jgi:aspartyl protease family protein